MNPRVLALALPVLCLLAVLQLQPVFVRPRPAPPLPGAGFSARREEVKQMPENPQIYFVHVGKAGGSTIARTLPLGHMIDALNCRTRMHELKQRRGQKSKRSEASCEDPVAAGNSSAFARHVVGHLHKNGDQSYGRNWRLGRWRREWLLNHTNAFVYSVRDPVDRLVSAYNYHRHEARDEAVVAAAAADDAASAAGACFPGGHEGTPDRAEFFRDCFPDGMEPLAAALTYRGAQKSRLRRRDFAARVVQGLPNRNPKKRELVSVWGSHFFFNYRRYARETLGRRPGRPVGVIRTEHLWDDLRGLDAALGGDGSGFRGGEPGHARQRRVARRPRVRRRPESPEPDGAVLPPARRDGGVPGPGAEGVQPGRGTEEGEHGRSVGALPHRDVGRPSGAAVFVVEVLRRDLSGVDTPGHSIHEPCVAQRHARTHVRSTQTITSRSIKSVALFLSYLTT